MSLIEGFLLGLGSILFIGPVFFVILKNTLEYGKLAGFYISIGILFSDFVYMVLYKYFLYDSIEKYLDTTYTYSLFALILFVMGVANILKKSKENSKVHLFRNNPITMFSKGFLINFVNPFVFLFWLGVFKYSSEKFDNFNQLLFLGSSLVGIFIIDMVKVLFSAVLKKYLNSDTLLLLYKIIGFIFISFSLYIVFLR